MVKSKLSRNGKKNVLAPSNKMVNTKKEDHKVQTKISSFFQKASHSSVPLNNLPSSGLINNKPFKISKETRLHSPEIIEDDSDIEIIESTPESISKKSSILKISEKISSPEIIPATPGTTSTIISSNTISASLLESNLQNKKPHSNMQLKTSLPLSKMNKGAKYLTNSKSSFKREAETGTGISPVSKRNNDVKDIKESQSCKMNILNRIDPPTCSKNILNEEDPLCGTSKVSREEDEIDDTLHAPEMVELNIVPHKDEIKNSVIMCPSEMSELGVVPLRNEIKKVLREDLSPDSQIDSILEETINENRAYLIKSSKQADKDCKKIKENPLDDLLTIDFDQFSPFKDIPPQTLPKLPVNNRIEKLLEEGLGSLSFACMGNFGRYIVMSVENDVYLRQILLNLISPINRSSKLCSLTGFWYETVVKEGDVIHVLFPQEENGKYTISNDKGMVVINPDFLISGTSIVSGVYCRRKAVLSEYFKGYDAGNKIMTVGSLVHQLFQEVVKKKTTSLEEIKHLMQELVTQPRVLKEFYKLGLAEETIEEEMSKFVPLIQSWSKTYLETNFSVVSGTASYPKDNWNGKVTSIEDIEENIWSPRFGIKGKVDLTVQTKCGAETKVVPLELKTGRASYSAEHKGQVTLYTMMMSDRRPDPKAGLLLYLRDGSMAEVPAGEKERRGLIQLRNDLVRFLSPTVTGSDSGEALLPPLPEPLNSQRSCSRCAQLLNCTALLKVQDDVPSSPHDMASLVPNTTAHLSASHLEYFRKWCLLHHLEVGASSNKSAVRALWCHDASQREASGTCLARMTLEGDLIEMVRGCFLHKMRRDALPNMSALPHNFQVGESIIVSSDKEIALSAGVVYTVAQDFLYLVLDRNLKIHQKRTNCLYQIDRCEYQSNMSIFFTNLSMLLHPSERSARLREILIEGNPPTFGEGLNRDDVCRIRGVLSELNREQQRAVLRSLLAKDYSILKGFPGTGKTCTIIGLVRILCTLGYSVLLTSYTHSAVDNILLKLKNYKEVKFLRLGKLSRIHKDILEYSDELQTSDLTSVNQIKEFYENTSVVATTCLGMGHVVFRHKIFDFCIMDEASQVLETAALGPLFFCSRFILVGDYLQLPPVIKSHTARSLGMAVSLFERLDKPNATVCLVSQYRMNEHIMALANHLMYDGQLKCAVEELRTASLSQMVSELDGGPAWLRKLTSPNLEDSVVFVDTSNDAPEEKNCSGQITNPLQVQLILALLRTFCVMGVPAEDIGVITPYRAQVNLLKEKTCLEESFGETVEVNTVDQYQGRDKSVILYSCVRSGLQPEQVQKGEILNDDRRLNVAVTRARLKLLIIGDLKTLQHFDPFRKILGTASQQGQIYELKEGVDQFSWHDIRSSIKSSYPL